MYNGFLFLLLVHHQIDGENGSHVRVERRILAVDMENVQIAQLAIAVRAGLARDAMTCVREACNPLALDMGSA